MTLCEAASLPCVCDHKFHPHTWTSLQQPGRIHEPRSTHPRRRTASLAVALAGVTVAATGCTVANSRHGGYDPNTLRIVLSQEPPTLEPCESSLTSTGIVVRSNITEPLIERDPNSGDLQPLLATEWRQTSPNQWTFKIRDGVTFSNGAPFTAKDAAFSIDRAVNSDLNCNVDGYVFGDDPLEVCRHPTTPPSSSAPRPRIRFCRCVSRSSRSCRAAPA